MAPRLSRLRYKGSAARRPSFKYNECCSFHGRTKGKGSTDGPKRFSTGSVAVPWGGIPDAVVDGLHQVLKVREDVGVGLVAVLGHHLAVYNHVKLAVGSWGELEVGDMLPSLG